jgi:16S rRNA (cytosine967-C5)-methyltransferase
MHSLVHAPMIIRGLPHGDHIDTELLEPHEVEGCHVFHGGREQLLGVLRDHPAALVQDPTAAAPGLATAELEPPPRTIVDACAGKGTKTRQLSMLHPQARIIATDIDANRLNILREDFRGVERVQIVEHHRLREFDEQADLLLLDVPCTNTGVLARRVEAKYRFDPISLKKLVDLQRQIVADSIPLLAPRGRIVYSTCSIETAENQPQAEWIAKWHRMSLNTSCATLPAGLPGQSPRQYRDGGYFAVLVRT